MQTEFTGRQVAITKALRAMAEEGLQQLEKILGRATTAHVVLSREKYRYTAEISLKTRSQMIVGVASSADVTMALRDALERTEKQAIRLKKKKIQVHRQSKEKTDAKAQSALLKRNNTVKQSGPPVPEDGTALELHVLPSKESVARHAMSIHEAVKEAAYRDRDVFVFRDNNGEIKVLHRTREGIVQLIEVP